MLVIMRDVGEVFSVGDDITVQILAIHGNQIRLGIEAPKDVKVHRAEVYQRIGQRHCRPSANVNGKKPDTGS